MVREHRLLTVKQGVNRIQFSWANTLIDPTSIDFRILDQQDKVDLVDTTFPAGRNDALQWNIQSQMAGKIAGRDPLLHQRHHLVGRLRGHRQRGRDEAEPDRLRPRVRTTRASCTTTPRRGWWWARSTWSRRSPTWPAGPPPGEDGPQDERATTARGVRRRRGARPRPRNGADMPAERPRRRPRSPRQVVKQGLSEYFLFTIEGREDINDKEPKRLVALKVAEVPLECFYKLTDRDGGTLFTKFYRFKNLKLLDEKGKEKKLSAMENLGLSPLPDGMVRLFSEYQTKDLAYVGGTDDQVRAHRRPRRGERRPRPGHHDPPPAEGPEDHQRRRPAVQAAARQHVRAVLRPDRLRRDVLLRGGDRLGQAGRGQVGTGAALRRQRGALGPEGDQPKDWNSDEPGAYVDLHDVAGKVEQVDQNHVKYFLDLQAGREAVRQVQRDLQAPQGRAGTEHREETRAAVDETTDRGTKTVTSETARSAI